jgi:hypothetical protein
LYSVLNASIYYRIMTKKPGQSMYAPHTEPPSPLRHKKRRLNSNCSEPIEPAPPPNIPETPFRFVDGSDTTIDVKTSGNPAEYTSNAMQADANTAYQDIAAQEQENKQTKRSYGRHIQSYQHWWDAYQPRVMAEDPMREFTPALPITSA